MFQNQLCAETGQKNIADAVKALDNKVSLLDANHVDQVHIMGSFLPLKLINKRIQITCFLVMKMEARLGILSQKLNYVASKQASVEEFEKSETVSDDARSFY